MWRSCIMLTGVISDKHENGASMTFQSNVAVTGDELIKWGSTLLESRHCFFSPQ